MTTTFSQTVLSPWLTPVRVVSTANIAGTYNNGPNNDGVGATLTIAASSLTVDSVALAVGDRLLLQTQTNAYETGIYVVDSIGSTVVLKRAADQQCLEQYKVGQYVSVGAGSVNAGNIYTVVEPLPAVLGVNNLVWNSDPSAGGVSFSGAASTANAIPVFSNTSGDIKAATTAATLGFGLTIQTGNFAVSAGNVVAGSSGNAGILQSFPAAAAKGSLRVVGVANTGDTTVTISNSAHGQATVVNIPDSGVATTRFILADTSGTQHITSGNLEVDAGNIIAGASGAAGTVSSFPSTAAKGSLKLAAIDNTGDTIVTISNAAHGQATVISIPDGGQATTEFIIADSAGTQHITSGSLQVDAGNLLAGASGAAGTLSSFPSTAAKGSLKLAAVDNTGDTVTTISNAAMGQASVVSIPDPGAATANFLLDAGAANILAMQEFVGLQSVLDYSAGTWTRTRIAQGNYVQRHTAGNDTTIIGIDITPQIRVAASKGFRLDSFDVIYSIATLALDAHSVVLDRIAYANNVAVSVTSIPITGALATATQANPYLTNVTIDTPAFDVTADSKYVMELTVDAAATTDYDFYGIMLRFSKTIG